MLKIGLHRHGWNHALERRGWSQQPHSPSFVSTEPRRFERCKCHHRGTEERPGDQGGTGHCAPTTSFVTPPPQPRPTAHTFPLLSINKQAKSPREPWGSLKTFFFFLILKSSPCIAPEQLPWRLTQWGPQLPSRNSNKKKCKGEANGGTHGEKTSRDFYMEIYIKGSIPA